MAGKAVPEHNSDTSTMPEHSIAKFTAPNARVLVVDDIRTNLTVAEGLLSPYKMRVDLCTSGQGSIDAVHVKKYDLILMDHMMPKMDGIEAAERIKKIDSDVPVVALTANAVPGTREMFLENGFCDFLSKPVDIAKLNILLEKWIPKEKQIIHTESAKPVEPEISDLNIEGIDAKKGSAAVGGKADIYMRILSVFYKDGKERIEQIKQCLETEDYNLYVTHVHSLKSAAASIGAFTLSQEAKELEHAGAQGNYDFVKANTDGFLENLEKLLQNISDNVSID